MPISALCRSLPRLSVAARHSDFLRPLFTNPRHICTPSRPSPPPPSPSAAAEAESLLRKIYDGSPSPADASTLSKALPLVRSAVSSGSPRGKALLASLHRDGLGVSRDAALAESLFRDSADAGDAMAQAGLGSMLLDRIRAADSVQEVASERLFLEQDADGKTRASVALAFDNDGEQQVEPQTPAELVRAVRKARRKAGFTDDQAQEFETYREKEKAEQKERDRAEALELLEKAVLQGNVQAMVRLANEVLEEDPHRAVKLYERAVKEGRDTDAYYNLGQIYTQGIDGIEPDHKKAAMNFGMAAQLGDASGQFYLGHLYMVGNEYVSADAASARQYIELAAEQEHPAAVYYLALMHRNGEGGLEVSHGAFKRYVTAAAKLGHGPAHACLGDMYYKGTDGVEVDYQKALRHFTEAGNLGESDALCSAAAMHFRGLGTTADHHQAFLLYQEAIQLGSIPALRNIGSMYYHGQGVPCNKKVAGHFFAMADENEAKAFEEGEEMVRNTPVTTAEAPKHPMGEIPREIQDLSGDDELKEQPATHK